MGSRSVHDGFTLSSRWVHAHSGWVHARFMMGSRPVHVKFTMGSRSSWTYREPRVNWVLAHREPSVNPSWTFREPTVNPPWTQREPIVNQKTCLPHQNAVHGSRLAWFTFGGGGGKKNPWKIHSGFVPRDALAFGIWSHLAKNILRFPPTRTK